MLKSIAIKQSAYFEQYLRQLLLALSVIQKQGLGLQLKRCASIYHCGRLKWSAS